MRFQLLGPVEVMIGDRTVPIGRRQERCLLAILALEAGQPVLLDRMIDVMWDGRPPLRARDVAQTYVSRLRATLGAAGADPDVVRRSGRSYVIDVDQESVDALRFERLVGNAQIVTVPAERSRLLREALAMWRGPALTGIGPDRVRERLGARLEERRREAESLRIDSDLAAGRHGELVGELSALTREAPFDEQLAGRLMIALYRSGRRTDALDAHAALRSRLRDEFGVDPSPEAAALYTKILRGDPSLAAPIAASPEPAMRSGPVPAQLPSDLGVFTGRVASLLRLREQLVEEPGTVVISGAGGIGKTTLAVHFAHAVAERFPDGQIYLDLHGFGPTGTAMSPADALRTLLEGLGTPPRSIPGSTAARAGLYRSTMAGRRMLLLLDNARDAAQVRQLLPGTPGCLIVITSRDDMAGLVATAGATPVTLSMLSADESREMLERRIGTARVAAEPGPVDGIIRHCAGLPLALAIVGARAATRPTIPLAALDAELERSENVIAALGGGDAATDVRTVFSWSYAALRPAAARLFGLIGFHCRPAVSTHAAASLIAATPSVADDLLHELCSAHLLSEAAPGRYTMHDLVRAYAADVAGASDLEDSRIRLFDHYLHSAYVAGCLLYPERRTMELPVPAPGTTVDEFVSDEAALQWYVTEHAALVATIVDGAERGPDLQTVQLAQTLVTYLDRAGHWQDRVTTNEAALRSAERSGNRAEAGHIHRSLGFAHALLAEHDLATGHFNRSMRINQELRDLSGEALAHVGLAHVLLRQDRHADAARHAEAAAELYRTAGNKGGLARALNAAGWSRAQLDQLDRALGLCQEAIGLFAASEDRHGEAATLDSIGYIHDRRGEYQDAAMHFSRAIEIYLRLGDVYRHAETLVHLAKSERSAGDFARADADGRRAIELMERHQHPAVDEIRALLAADSAT